MVINNSDFEFLKIIKGDLSKKNEQEFEKLLQKLEKQKIEKNKIESERKKAKREKDKFYGRSKTEIEKMKNVKK